MHILINLLILTEGGQVLSGTHHTNVVFLRNLSLWKKSNFLVSLLYMMPHPITTDSPLFCQRLHYLWKGTHLVGEKTLWGVYRKDLKSMCWERTKSKWLIWTWSKEINIFNRLTWQYENIIVLNIITEKLQNLRLKYLKQSNISSFFQVIIYSYEDNCSDFEKRLDYLYITLSLER